MEVTEPTDEMTNGTVTLELELSDPVGKAGIETRLLELESEKSFVTGQLAEHLWCELGIDVEQHDIDVVE